MSRLPFDIASLDSKALHSDLQARGVSVLEHGVDPKLLSWFRSDVDDLISKHGRRYFSIINPQEGRRGPYEHLVSDMNFYSKLIELADLGCAEEGIGEQAPYSVLRIIAGDDAEKRAFEFHFDASTLTVLIPIYIPEGSPSESGTLVALPNKRNYRRFALINVLEKALYQNPLAYALYKRFYGSGLKNAISLVPGNIYLFWGYRTLHGNLPCAPGAKRATYILHLGNPHRQSLLTQAIRSGRRIREGFRLRGGK